VSRTASIRKGSYYLRYLKNFAGGTDGGLEVGKRNQIAIFLEQIECDIDRAHEVWLSGFDSGAGRHIEDFDGQRMEADERIAASIQHIYVVVKCHAFRARRACPLPRRFPRAPVV
jgi:hypothetical protein